MQPRGLHRWEQPAHPNSPLALVGYGALHVQQNTPLCTGVQHAPQRPRLPLVPLVRHPQETLPSKPALCCAVCQRFRCASKCALPPRHRQRQTTQGTTYMQSKHLIQCL